MLPFRARLAAALAVLFGRGDALLTANRKQRRALRRQGRKARRARKGRYAPGSEA